MIEQLQRTAEWFEKRKGRITGSSAGAALGLCPWRSPDDVIRAMVREHHGYPDEFDAAFVADFGKQYERASMLAFMRETGLDVEDCKFYPYEDWSGASPDGITSDDAVLEIKVPYSLRKQNPAVFKPLMEQQHYYAQVQIEMLSSSKLSAYFYQYVPEQGDIFSPEHVPAQSMLEEIEYDAYWMAENLPKLRAFYERYLSELDNKAHLEPKRVVIDTDEAQSIVNRIGELDDGMSAMAEERKDLLAKLIEIAGNKDAEVCGHKLTLVVRKGNVDYAKLLKDVAPDADTEAYRKQSSESWRFS